MFKTRFWTEPFYHVHIYGYTTATKYSRLSSPSYKDLVTAGLVFSVLHCVFALVIFSNSLVFDISQM